MPIYEFQCNQCGMTFDQLCRINWQGSVKCPSCGKEDLTKIISQVSGLGRGAGDHCSSCSGKSCNGCN
ncbi:FmdB family zinc ribbon protein [Methylomusa anaerophila]